MKLYDRIKDFFDNFLAKTAAFAILCLIIVANFHFVENVPNSALDVIKTIDTSMILGALMLPMWGASFFMFIIHEFLKLLKIERKHDMVISAILAILFAIILILINLLTILTENQFNLIVTLFGLPGLVFLPKLFHYLLKFRHLDLKNTDGPEKETNLQDDDPKDRFSSQ